MLDNAKNDFVNSSWICWQMNGC